MTACRIGLPLAVVAGLAGTALADGIEAEILSAEEEHSAKMLEAEDQDDRNVEDFRKAALLCVHLTHSTNQGAGCRIARAESLGQHPCILGLLFPKSWCLHGHESVMGLMSIEPATARSRLLVGFGLDHLWAESMGLLPGDTKESPLRLVADVLNRERVAYALISGVAIQIRTAEPRTTLDIDVAVPSFSEIPRAALLAAGFEHAGRHEHSDNWRAPAGGPTTVRTAVQFSAEDVGITEAVQHAETLELSPGLRMRVAMPADLLVLKLEAALEPRRRPSKRQHDIADAVALLEEHPELRTPATLARVRQARLAMLEADSGS